MVNLTELLTSVLDDVRPADHKMADICGLKSYILEFRTIQINLGRQKGHTTAIRELMTPWDMVFLPNKVIEKQFISGCKQTPFSAFNVCSVEHINTFNRSFGAFNWKIPRRVFIDNASLLSKENINLVYDSVARHPEQVFILLS